MKYRQRISITYSYPIIFTRDIFSAGNKTLDSVFKGLSPQVLFFVDSNLVRKNKSILKKIDEWSSSRSGTIRMAGPTQVVPAGETIKSSPAQFSALLKKFQSLQMCRHSYTVIIGGGAVLDTIGFAAAIMHRGIRQIRIPTTVLSQNDSGVGVKNGINMFGIKNLFGTFTPPDAVINDSLFLETLAMRDWVAGVSEAFKVGIIKDAGFIEYLSRNTLEIAGRNMPVMEEIIRRCAFLHCEHIRHSRDAFERTNSRPLDFGHWAAHRLESLSRSRLRHGEAVALGIALDLLIAARLNLLEHSDARKIIATMQRCGLPIWSDLMEFKDRSGRLKLLKGIEDFRQHLGGELTIAMPFGLGRMTEIHELPEASILQSIAELKKIGGSS